MYKNEEGKYIVSYYIDDWVVKEEIYDDPKDACEAVAIMDFGEEDSSDEDEEYEKSYFVGARMPNESWLLWYNTEGERGSDYSGDDPEILALLDEYL